MLRSVIPALLISVTSLCAAATAARAAPPPAAVEPTLAGTLGQLPGLENVVLSPAATRLAFVRTVGEERFLSVYDMVERKVIFIARVSGQKLRGLDWLDNERLILMTSTTTMAWGLLNGREEWFQAQVLNLRTKRPRALNMSVDGVDTMNVVLRMPQVRTINGRPLLLIEGFYAPANVFHQAMFLYDDDTGRYKIIAKSDVSSADWIVGDDGVVLASTDYEESTQMWHLRVRQGDKLVVTTDGRSLLGHPQLLGLSREPGVAIVSVKEDEHYRWQKLSLATGKLGDDYSEGQPFYSLLYERGSQRIMGGRTKNEAQYVFLDPERQKQWDSIVAAYGRANLTLISNSVDFKKLVVLVDGADLGYYYELFDLDARRGFPLGDVYEGVKSIAPATNIDYAAHDGLNIPAVLTLPRDRPAKNLPLIVLAHGGPASHVTVHFDWWREALAEQGYAVLEPNFRGSDIDYSLESAGFGEWGRKMQTDLSDGVRFLTKNGTIDPTRVCIVGASYGGYAALAGITLDPGVYRCAVSVAGISDLRRMLRWEDAQAGRRNSSTQRYWDRYMGVTGPDDPLLSTISPIAHLDAVNVPLLLIHGKDDTVVPYEQSEVMRDALKKAGKNVELVTLKSEDHWLSRGATRAQMLEETLRHLRRYNPPD